uniref:uncharacterized protein n=1 Tax=Centroberyx gerrardi TaxID=166262 RepID=UPI003AAF8774
MSMTQKYPDNGGLRAELGSVFRSNTSTEQEWEDPVQRKGLTTFKVVPSKKQRSYEVELSLDVPDQCQILADDNSNSDASAEARDNQTETQEDPCSPESSEAEVPLPNSELQVSDSPPSPPPLPDPENPYCQSSPPSEVEENLEKLKEEDTPSVKSELPLDHSDGELVGDSNFNTELERESLQSPSDQSLCTEMDQPTSETDEKAVEEEEDQQDNFPPPPPPVFYCEDIEGMEEGREDPVASSLPSSKPSSPISNGETNVFSGDHQDELTSATSYQSPTAPKPQKKMSTVPSRFAQAVALAVQRSRFQIQGKGLNPQVSHGPRSTLPSPPGPHTNTPQVPDWLPHTSLNGSSCLG